MDNGHQLRSIIKAAEITQVRALELFNEGQARPLTIGQWKAYLANQDSVRRSPCPDNILKRMQELLKEGRLK